MMGICISVYTFFDLLKSQLKHNSLLVHFIKSLMLLKLNKQGKEFALFTEILMQKQT